MLQIFYREKKIIQEVNREKEICCYFGMSKLKISFTRFWVFTEFNSNLGRVKVDCNTFYCHLQCHNGIVLDVDVDTKSEVHEMHTCAIINIKS